jgi:hypothetical protein
VTFVSRGDLFEDSPGGSGTDERFAVGVVLFEIAHDRLLQVGNAVEDAAAVIRCSVISVGDPAKKRSTNLSQEVEIGVKSRWKRGCAASSVENVSRLIR